jgi:hypothetical protein
MLGAHDKLTSAIPGHYLTCIISQNLLICVYLGGSPEGRARVGRSGSEGPSKAGEKAVGAVSMGDAWHTHSYHNCYPWLLSNLHALP